MQQKFDIATRKPIWIALSELYLDTELQDYDYKLIARKIYESPYTIKEVKKINKTEVFPMLFTNLISIGGEWRGFDESWLTESIQLGIQKRNFFKKLSIMPFRWWLKSVFSSYWEAIEKAYAEMYPSKT